VPEMDLIIDSGDATGGSSPRVAPPLPSTLSVALSINGDPVNAEVDTRLTLLDFLRERARLTGTKKGVQPRRVRHMHSPG
jgi:xanthine dehydrogenase YagT iron-sulfur-binding subunit